MLYEVITLDPAIYEEALEQEGARPMDFTGRTMKGFVFVSESALSGAKAIAYSYNFV